MNAISVFELYIEQALYSVRDPSTVNFFIGVSELASTTTAIGLSVLIAAVLVHYKRWSLVAGLFTAVFGSAAMVFILKEIIARPRPGAPLYAFIESSYSFPSGHATLSAALYFFVLWLLFAIIPAAWRYVAAFTVTIIVLVVGFSRLYLGVHYLSDVLAGYVLGGLFVLLGIKVAKKLERKTISASPLESSAKGPFLQSDHNRPV
jgi:membrane-associated phospholipid phosphatase